MPTEVRDLGQSYELITTGPAFFETREDKGIRLHFGVGAPADDTEAYHLITAERSVAYHKSENTYARANHSYGGKLVYS